MSDENDYASPELVPPEVSLPERFNQRQLLGLEAMLATRSVSEAAAHAGVTARTFYRWLADKDFSDELNRRRRQAVDQTTARLQRLSGAAADALEIILVSDSDAPRGKVGAIRLALHYAYRATEIEELLTRLDTARSDIAAIERQERGE
jgi:AcrR family transcriptional regulator